MYSQEGEKRVIIGDWKHLVTKSLSLTVFLAAQANDHEMTLTWIDDCQRQAIMGAIDRGNHELLQKILETRRESDPTYLALEQAVANNDERMIRELARTEYYLASAINIAIRWGQHELARKLILQLSPLYLDQCLPDAILTLDRSIFRFLLNQKVDLDLALAVVTSSAGEDGLELIKELVERGANPNFGLHPAIKFTEWIEVLVEEGAEVKLAQEIAKVKGVELTIKSSQERKLLEYLRREFSSRDLILLASSGNWKMVNQLVRNGFPANLAQELKAYAPEMLAEFVQRYPKMINSGE